MDFFFLMMPLIGLTTLAMFFLVSGLRGIITRRPFLVSARWSFYPLLLLFLPPTLETSSLETSSLETNGMDGFSILIFWFSLLFFSWILFWFWSQSGGYIAYAVTDRSFREALISALNKMDLPFEERLSTIRIESNEADLELAAKCWKGVGQIDVKRMKHRGLLTKIVKEMNEYFRASSASTNMISLISCISEACFGLLGMSMVIFALVVVFFIDLFI